VCGALCHGCDSWRRPARPASQGTSLKLDQRLNYSVGHCYIAERSNTFIFRCGAGPRGVFPPPLSDPKSTSFIVRGPSRSSPSLSMSSSGDGPPPAPGGAHCCPLAAAPPPPPGPAASSPRPCRGPAGRCPDSRARRAPPDCASLAPPPPPPSPPPPPPCKGVGAPASSKLTAFLRGGASAPRSSPREAGAPAAMADAGDAACGAGVDAVFHDGRAVAGAAAAAAPFADAADDDHGGGGDLSD
jgi:hypothetical protein